MSAVAEEEDDERSIRRLSNSPYLLTIADSIHKNLKPDTLAEVIAAYLYFKSKEGLGEKDASFLKYVLPRMLVPLGKLAAAVTPSVVAGLIADENFRHAFVSAFESSILGRNRGLKRSETVLSDN